MINTQEEYNAFIEKMANDPLNHHNYLEESCEAILANPLWDPTYYFLVTNWEWVLYNPKTRETDYIELIKDLSLVIKDLKDDCANLVMKDIFSSGITLTKEETITFLTNYNVFMNGG